MELPERFEEPSDEDRLLLPLDERLLPLEERLLLPLEERLLPLEERLLPLEDRLLLPLEERLRPLDELAALDRPESDFELLRRERLPLLAAELRSEDLTSPSSIVPRHSPDSSSFIIT